MTPGTDPDWGDTFTAGRLTFALMSTCLTLDRFAPPIQILTRAMLRVRDVDLMEPVAARVRVTYVYALDVPRERLALLDIIDLLLARAADLTQDERGLLMYASEASRRKR